MAIRIHTWRGWVTPGSCNDCGAHRDWIQDGRGGIYCSCQIPEDEEQDYEAPDPLDWKQIEVRPNTTENLTTAGYINWLDGPELSAPFLVPVENVNAVETDKDLEDVLDIVSMIQDEGWFRPIVVDEEGNIIDGHHRLLAMEYLGTDQILVQEITYPSS